MVIYETHVRGCTFHPSSEVTNPGTFRGLAEKIPYFQHLGVTAIELMPVQEFNENELARLNPLTGERLRNYWGYSPAALFAPKGSYGGRGSHGDQVFEFRNMVKAFHLAGIEVILDIVLNSVRPSASVELIIQYFICCKITTGVVTRIIRASVTRLTQIIP